MRWTLAALAALLTTSLVAAVPLAGMAEARGQRGSIAFSGERAGTRAVFLRNPDGSGLRPLPVGGRSDDPAFSPQGRRLAFTSYGPQGAQIWITYLDGTGLRPLTSGPGDGMAAWSPDAATLAFARGPRGRRDIYTIVADGSGLRRLTRSGYDDYSPSFSPSGQVAFVRSTPSGEHVYVVGARGGRARRLTAARDSSPSWSPTGRTLVVVRDHAGGRDLFLVRADGSSSRRLTHVPGDELEPAWSPDGSRIVFSHRRRGRRRLYLMKVRGSAVATLPARSRRVRRLSSSRSDARHPSWQAVGLDPVVVAVGDIACDPSSPYFNAGLGVPARCRQRMTSDLLLRLDLSSVLVLGDAQYEDGKLWKFQASFDQSWGRLKQLIRPVPGNHEYGDPGAAGYFDYFDGPGTASGPAGVRGQGYYSFDLGSWHVIALNSECRRIGGCQAGGPQEQWLRADLAAHPAACTLAYWHRPRFTSGSHGAGDDVLPLWNALYEAGADLILDAHEHFYERFAPQTPAGTSDGLRGVRQFTVGTGGKDWHSFVGIAPGSEVRDNRTFGVLSLTLREGAYDWRLLGAPGAQPRDSGSARCH